MSLVQMSLSGAAMIGAILVIRTAALHRLPKRFFILLWEAALVRLLIPFSFPTALSAYTLLQRLLPGGVLQNPGAEVLNEAAGWNTAAVQHAGIVGNGAMNQGGMTGIAAAGGAAGSTADAAQTGWLGHLPELWSGTCFGVPLWRLIWLVGALLCAACFLALYLRCVREFRTSLPVHHEAAARWLKGHPLRRRVSLRQSDRVQTPLTYGIWRPVILLPKDLDWKDSRQLEYILLHEHIHIRRLDALRKLLLTAVLCLHWWNPLVWLMYLLFNRDIELACDEAVVWQSGARSRRTYAKTLIGMEEKRSMALPLCNSFSENAVKERVTAIMKTRKLTIGIGIVCALLLAAVVIFFATSSDDGEQTVSRTEEQAGGTQTISPDGTHTISPDDIQAENIQEADGGQATDAQPESSAADIRESTTILHCMIEGMEEEMPATLYVGDGFSIYIPDEGWLIYEEEMVLPVKMSAVYSADTGLWVEYHEESAADTEAGLLAQGYTVNTESGRLEMQAGEILNEIRIFTEADATWLVCSRRPATTEGVEGISVRLEAIAETFAVTGDAGAAQGQTGSGEAQAGSSTGQMEEAESAAQAELREAATDFYTAYFTGDTAGVQEHISALSSSVWDVYDRPEDAELLEIRGLRGLEGAAEDGADRVTLSLAFIAPGEDSYTYLTMEWIREADEWKVLSYGLEK